MSSCPWRRATLAFPRPQSRWLGRPSPRSMHDWPRWLLPTEANERRQFTIAISGRSSGDLLTASPPGEKATARQDQTRQSGTGDGAGNIQGGKQPVHLAVDTIGEEKGVGAQFGMAAARQGLPVRLDRAPQRGAAFAITRASRRARTRSIGSRSRARASSLIFDHPPAVAPPPSPPPSPGPAHYLVARDHRLPALRHVHLLMNVSRPRASTHQSRALQSLLPVAWHGSSDRNADPCR
jgi:hypothetical protein